jgi:hypothetical protein
VLLFIPIDWRAEVHAAWTEACHRLGHHPAVWRGLALGELAFATGRPRGRSKPGGWPAETYGLYSSGFAILVSEVTSSTVTATMVVPVALVAQAAGVRPLERRWGNAPDRHGFHDAISAASTRSCGRATSDPAMIRHG